MATEMTLVSQAVGAGVGAATVVALGLWFIRRWITAVDKKLDVISTQISKHGEAIAAINERNKYRDELCRERHKGE